MHTWERKKNERKSVKSGAFSISPFPPVFQLPGLWGLFFSAAKTFSAVSLRIFSLIAATRASGTLAESREQARWPVLVAGHLPTGSLEVASRMSPGQSSPCGDDPDRTGTLQSPRLDLPGSAFAAQWIQCELFRSDRSYNPHHASQGAAVSDHCVL